MTPSVLPSLAVNSSMGKIRTVENSAAYAHMPFPLLVKAASWFFFGQLMPLWVYPPPPPCPSLGIGCVIWAQSSRARVIGSGIGV